MWSSKKVQSGALVVGIAVFGAAFIWVTFHSDLAFACCLVAPLVLVSVFLYLALNRFGRSKRYRYVGFFLPVLCTLIWALVVYLLGRAQGSTEGEDILKGLTETYVIEVGVAFLCLASCEIRRRRKATRGDAALCAHSPRD
jgi:hypothetical protein